MADSTALPALAARAERDPNRPSPASFHVRKVSALLVILEQKNSAASRVIRWKTEVQYSLVLCQHWQAQLARRARIALQQEGPLQRCLVQEVKAPALAEVACACARGGFAGAARSSCSYVSCQPLL